MANCEENSRLRPKGGGTPLPSVSENMMFYLRLQHSDILARTGFNRIFELAPEALRIFSFANAVVDEEKSYNDGSVPESLYKLPAFKAHAKHVVMMLESIIVTMMGDGEDKALAQRLEDLGARHVSVGVHPAHYSVVETALLRTLASALGPTTFTEDVRKGWAAVIKFVSKGMMEGAGAQLLITKTRRYEMERQKSAILRLEVITPSLGVSRLVRSGTSLSLSPVHSSKNGTNRRSRKSPSNSENCSVRSPLGRCGRETGALDIEAALSVEDGCGLSQSDRTSTTTTSSTVSSHVATDFFLTKPDSVPSWKRPDNFFPETLKEDGTEKEEVSAVGAELAKSWDRLSLKDGAPTLPQRSHEEGQTSSFKGSVAGAMGIYTSTDADEASSITSCQSDGSSSSMNSCYPVTVVTRDCAKTTASWESKDCHQQEGLTTDFNDPSYWDERQYSP